MLEPLWLIIGVVVSLPVLAILYQAACALANEEVSFWKSLFISTLTFYACLGLGWIIVTQMGKQDPPGPDRFGLMHTLGVLAAIGVGWLLSAVVYTPFVHMRLGRGFLVASLETLLLILLSLLVGAVVMVVLALLQALQTGRFFA
jgi:hypothetical protein